MIRSNPSQILGLSPLRAAVLLLAGAFVLSTSAPADARHRSSRHSEDTEKEDAGESKSGKGKPDKNAGKPKQLGTYGDWNALAATGKERTCYALGAPKERSPASKLKDTKAYVFISTRPGEGVRDEVAINLGYPTKDNSSANANIDGDDFELITKGTNAWVKNPAKEKEFVESLKGGAKLVVKATSAKGSATTDVYSLKGLSDALARAAQECK
jgi:hypothetical protein